MTLLIIYDLSAMKALEIREFSEAERADALRARFAAEDAHRNNPDIEVAMLSAGCRETIERTHSRYFREQKK